MPADPFVPTPPMIAAAWAVLRARWPGQPHLLGPGPGFVEAITAAFAVMPAQVAALTASPDAESEGQQP